MGEFASTQQAARNAWLSPYPFEIRSGGLGAVLSCSGTSSRTPLVGTGTAYVLTNNGAATAWLAFGDDEVVATNAYFPVPAGEQLTVTLLDTDAATHVAGITAGSNVTVNIHRGGGV